jgi:hypothetical protein
VIARGEGCTKGRGEVLCSEGRVILEGGVHVIPAHATVADHEVRHDSDNNNSDGSTDASNLSTRTDNNEFMMHTATEWNRSKTHTRHNGENVVGGMAHPRSDPDKKKKREKTRRVRVGNTPRGCIEKAPTLRACVCVCGEGGVAGQRNQELTVPEFPPPFFAFDGLAALGAIVGAGVGDIEVVLA